MVGNGGYELLMGALNEATGAVSARGIRTPSGFVVCSEVEAPSIRAILMHGGMAPAERCFTWCVSGAKIPGAEEFVYGTIWGDVENGQMDAHDFTIHRACTEPSPSSEPHPSSFTWRCEAEQLQFERLHAQFPNSWITVYLDSGVVVYRILEYVDESNYISEIGRQRIIGASISGARIQHKLSEFSRSEIEEARAFIRSIDETLLVDFGDSKRSDGDLVLKLTLLAENSSINRQVMNLWPELIDADYLIRAVDV